jgi:DNA-binding LacI/PurR family transcriptional regulator
MRHGRARKVMQLSTNKAVRPTTADVARLASVSTATVSYVLNDAEGRRISAQTREAVHRAAQLLGYRPNLAARNLARGKSGVVLYVVPHVSVGEMPMQAGSRMTTELARMGLLQVQRTINMSSMRSRISTLSRSRASSRSAGQPRAR